MKIRSLFWAFFIVNIRLLFFLKWPEWPPSTEMEVPGRVNCKHSKNGEMNLAQQELEEEKLMKKSQVSQLKEKEIFIAKDLSFWEQATKKNLNFHYSRRPFRSHEPLSLLGKKIQTKTNRMPKRREKISSSARLFTAQHTSADGASLLTTWCRVG